MTIYHLCTVGATAWPLLFNSLSATAAVMTTADLWGSWKRPAVVECCLRGSRSCRQAAETRGWTLCKRVSGRG